MESREMKKVRAIPADGAGALAAGHSGRNIPGANPWVALPAIRAICLAWQASRPDLARIGKAKNTSASAIGRTSGIGGNPKGAAGSGIAGGLVRRGPGSFD